MRTSASQFQLLVEFMERNGDLSKPTEGPQGRMTNIHLWSQLTNMLNADATGDTKTVDKWRKVCSDMKNNTKKKAARIHRHASGTGGGPSSRLELTELEQRVMNIIGPQAATGIIQVGEIGLDQDPPSRIEISEVEVQESTDGTVAFWSQVVDIDEANQLPLSVNMEPSPQVPIDHPTRTVDDAQPMPEAPPIPTPLPPTPRRRRRRLLQNVSSPSHRRTRTQTQSELARQAFVASDNEWRVFQRESERERIRLRERALDQQDRWLDLFGQFIALGNSVVDIFRNN